MEKVESSLEKAIFMSRWILAPMYLGLSFTLLILLYSFCHHLWIVVPNINNLEADDIVLVILELIDLSLCANLILLVIFSGYENFVSKMNLTNHEELPLCKNIVDFSALKIKLISSVIAIASISLLKYLFSLKDLNDKQVNNAVIIYSVIVLSGLVMSLMDYLASVTKRNKN